MKKTSLFLIFFLAWACSGQTRKVPSFGSDVIRAEGVVENVLPKGIGEAVADAEKNAFSLAMELFSDRELVDENPAKVAALSANTRFYIKKTKIRAKSVNNGWTRVEVDVHFLTEKFVSALKRENLLSAGQVRTAVFGNFYSSYPLSMEKFGEGFEKDIPAGFSFVFSTAPFDSSSPSMAKFDYILLFDVYSYSINAAAEMGVKAVPAVSSGTFKLLSAQDMRVATSFDVQENSMEGGWEESVAASLLACGASARADLIKAINQEEAKKKTFDVVFSKVRDLNMLLAIKKVFNSIPVLDIYLKSFYKDDAVFSVNAGGMSPEELSSFIIRTNTLPAQIEYVDKAEIKFTMI